MRKLIYSFMLTAACILFASCGEKEHTFSGTYVFADAELDIRATANSAERQAIVDEIINTDKTEGLEAVREEFDGATITVDGINNTATMQVLDYESDECSFIQKNGKCTMTTLEDPFTMTGTISKSELKLTYDSTDDMMGYFGKDVTLEKYEYTLTFVKK